ncbi:MAG: ROK family protein [Acidimicrobiia bacterium]
MATVGIDVGGTKCLGVAIAGGEVAAELKVPTPAAAPDLLATLAALARELESAAGEPVTGLGVGVPGLVDRAGVLHFAPNLKGAEGLDVRAGVAQETGLAVAVDNDATCAAWGERQLGAAQGMDDVVLVTLGTGIGGGIVVDGRIERGAQGFAGEVGHMVVDPHGPPCPCGRRGCWERFASGSGLGELARQAALAGRAGRVVELAGGDAEAVQGEHVSLALAEGDREAAAVVAGYAEWLALGLANLAYIFDPEAIVVGGGVVNMGEALFGPARAALRRELPAATSVAVLPATLGERAGAIGAAFLAPDGG